MNAVEKYKIPGTQVDKDEALLLNVGGLALIGGMFSFSCKSLRLTRYNHGVNKNLASSK